MINKWLIGVRGYGDTQAVCILALKLELLRQDALEMAAWIASVADRRVPVTCDRRGPCVVACLCEPGSEFENMLSDIETGNTKTPERKELTGVLYDPGSSSPLEECKCDYVHVQDLMYERRPRPECETHPGEQDEMLVGSYPQDLEPT